MMYQTQQNFIMFIKHNIILLCLADTLLCIYVLNTLWWQTLNLVINQLNAQILVL